jgi:diguanylate cyclase (GGDEF)-like protein
MIENKNKTAGKVLIADDDPEILELLRFALESETYQVIAAANGEEAFELVKSEHPDIVVLDVNMPKMTGYETLDSIRNNPATCLVPVIMLTSLSKTKDKLTGIKLGADEYLSKPFEVMELVGRIEGLLRRTRESFAANPLTGLPGNVSIEKEIRKRLETKRDFAVVYCDVDNFKSFNDKYGFERGDGAIRLTATVLNEAVSVEGNENDFLGHIGGDDFVVITTIDKALLINERAIRDFDARVPELYDDDARAEGFIRGLNRQGKETIFPIMTISLGVVKVASGTYIHYSLVVEKAVEMLRKAKAEAGSGYVIG